ILNAMEFRREPASAEPETAAQPADPISTAANRSPGGGKRERDPRIPPAGTVLERDHNGDRIRVKVLEDGFLYKGRNFRSLSAVAKEATGTVWNGLLYFGLAKREDRLRPGADDPFRRRRRRQFVNDLPFLSCHLPLLLLPCVRFRSPPSR